MGESSGELDDSSIEVAVPAAAEPEPQAPPPPPPPPLQPKLDEGDATPRDTGDGAAAASPDGLDPDAHSSPPREQAMLRAAVPANTCCGRDLSAPHTVGPFLLFRGMEGSLDPPNLQPSMSVGGSLYPTPGVGVQAGPRTWRGSILIVTKAPLDEVSAALLDESGAPIERLNFDRLDAYQGWSALRFMLRLPVHEQQRKIAYEVTVSGKPLRPHGGEPTSFYIPGLHQPAHWGFYSCSGFSSDVPAEKREKHWGNLQPLWDDVRRVHAQRPLHLMVGGGDQIYCDDLWTLPSLRRFLDLPHKTTADKNARHDLPFDKDMSAEVQAYYFSAPSVGDVYANVPQVMTWDDHDIFDGWGSYRPYLQESAVFKGIFEAANRWYCVFQQHCRPKEKEPVLVYELGSRTALVACDQRHRRHRNQIMPLEHYMRITMLCNSLPQNVRHVVFVFTVPVVYPHLPGAQRVLSVATKDCVQPLLGACGASPVNEFGEADLDDDLQDHWTAQSHEEERRFLIENLQMLSKYRGCRVSMVSGDVHVCGAGYLISDPRPPREADLRHDFRYMPQIVSSAIANPPPPAGLMKVLDYFATGGKINQHTAHHMLRIFKNPAGLGAPLANKRNWCEVLERQADDPDMLLAGALTFRLRVEDDPQKGAPTPYDITVPPLEPVSKAHRAGEDEYFDVHSVPPLQRGCFRCCFGRK